MQNFRNIQTDQIVTVWGDEVLGNGKLDMSPPVASVKLAFVKMLVFKATEKLG